MSRRTRIAEHRRDVCAGALLIAAALAIGGAWLAGAAYLDCRHARLAPVLRYCDAGYHAAVAPRPARYRTLLADLPGVF